MKNIYVTVAEFLENGGILILPNGGQRKLFNANGIQFSLDRTNYLRFKFALSKRLNKWL